MNVEVSSKFKVRGIPSAHIHHFWPFAEPYIKRALDRANGEFLPSDIKQYCEDQAIQLWLISCEDRVIGAVTTEIVNYPRKRHLRVVTLAGSRAHEWAEQLDTILLDWAQFHQCSAIEAYVRRGLVPAMLNHGYKHRHAVVSKDI